MLLADTNILSTFAKVNQLALLFRLFGDERIGIVPAEVVQIQFQEMAALGTLEEYLAKCGYQRDNSSLIPQADLIGFEKAAAQMA